MAPAAAPVKPLRHQPRELIRVDLTVLIGAPFVLQSLNRIRREHGAPLHWPDPLVTVTNAIEHAARECRRLHGATHLLKDVSAEYYSAVNVEHFNPWHYQSLRVHGIDLAVLPFSSGSKPSQYRLAFHMAQALDDIQAPECGERTVAVFGHSKTLWDACVRARARGLHILAFTEPEQVHPGAVDAVVTPEAVFGKLMAS